MQTRNGTARFTDYVAITQNSSLTNAQPLSAGKSLIIKDLIGAGEGIRTLDPNLGKVVQSLVMLCHIVSST